MGGDPPSPMAAVVETMADARAAVNKAMANGQHAHLISPIDAALKHGILWFAELQRSLRKEFPSAEFTLTLDCADRPDMAHAALVEGIKSIRFRGHPDATAAIADVANQLGAKIDNNPGSDD